MPRKAMDVLTESMFYVLMAFRHGPKCGVEVIGSIDRLTKGRVVLGPGTLYTILGKFETEGYLKEVAVEGRKRTYALTEAGEQAYQQELARLHQCLSDAERWDREEETEDENQDRGQDRPLLSLSQL